jgi:hypothetical protein
MSQLLETGRAGIECGAGQRRRLPPIAQRHDECESVKAAGVDLAKRGALVVDAQVVGGLPVTIAGRGR